MKRMRDPSPLSATGISDPRGKSSVGGAWSACTRISPLLHLALPVDSDVSPRASLPRRPFTSPRDRPTSRLVHRRGESGEHPDCSREVLLNVEALRVDHRLQRAPVDQAHSHGSHTVRRRG